MEPELREEENFARGSDDTVSRREHFSSQIIITSVLSLQQPCMEGTALPLRRTDVSPREEV